MPKIAEMTEPTPWEGSYGTMYETHIVFDDGSEGRVNMKTPTRWKIGDDVEITDRQPNDKYGDKLKIGTPDETFKSSSSGDSNKFTPEIQAKIDSSWAITSAISLLGESAKEHAKGGGLASTAELMLEIRKGLIKKIQNEQS